MTVYDPANFAKNTLTELHTLGSRSIKRTQISNQLQQLAYQLQSLRNIPNGIWGEIQDDLAALSRIAKVGQSISYADANLSTEFTHMYPGYQVPTNYTQAYTQWATNSLGCIQGALPSSEPAEHAIPERRRAFQSAPRPPMQQQQFSGVRRHLRVRHRRLHVRRHLRLRAKRARARLFRAKQAQRNVGLVLPAEHCYAKRERCREIGRRWRDRSATRSAVVTSSAFIHKAMAAPTVAVAPSAPWAHAQKDAVVEVSRAVIAVGRAGVRRISVVAIGADWLNADVNHKLRLSSRRNSQAREQCCCTD